jgi:hypothetical protein
VEGSGPPLVLQYGFTLSIESWGTYGYVPALRDEYRAFPLPHPSR